MTKMPVIFVGHGNPMNAIEDNEFTQEWKRIATTFEKPKAILCISAHWYKNGSRINDQDNPEMIYDMYGFSQELYDLKYPVKGNKQLANQIIDEFKDSILIDNSWGIDHGTWTVLNHMYPNADIPVLQLSVDNHASSSEWFEIGKVIAKLRNEGVLIIGSGNIVHNLRLVNWNMSGGYDWAYTFDRYIKNNILFKNFENIINYQESEVYSHMVFEHPDHFAPLIYILGCVDKQDEVSVFNEKCLMGSISMSGYIFK